VLEVAAKDFQVPGLAINVVNLSQNVDALSLGLVILAINAVRVI
jgi:hypothetical protein